MKLNTKVDKWYFSGDEEMNTNLTATAASDQSSSYPEIRTGVVRLGSTDHGFKASPQLYGPKAPNLIYIQGTTYYDGMRKIVAVATDTFDIVASYTAETTATGDIARPGFKFDHDVLFKGFKLHLDAASATAENMVCSVDADRGAGWDVNLYTKDMNTIQDIIYMCEEDVIIPANDIVYFTWTNTNNTLWGLEVHTQRLI